MQMEKYERVKITPSKALDIYLEKYPDTIVKEVELELKSGRFIYEVEGYDDEQEYELKIDSENGNILEVEIEFFKGNHERITREATDKIEPLVEKALKEAGEGTALYEYELDIEKRRLVLEVKMTLANGQYTNHKYDLDTGDLIRKK